MTKWILILIATAGLAAAQPGAKDVLAAAETWKKATMAKDRAALDKILHPDLSYTHSNGRNETKADVLKSVTTGIGKVEAIDFSETNVRLYGDTALMQGNIDIRNNTDGKAATANLNVLLVWRKGPGGWQMVARHALRRTP